MNLLKIKISIFSFIIVITLPLFVSSASMKNIAEQKQNKDKILSLKIAELRSQFQIAPQSLREISRLEEKYPQTDVGAPKYQRSGHQFTTYIIAFLAGLGRERSHKLAYFSQFPDDEVRFSATMAFFYFWDPEYRKQVMATLHSLHGGDSSAVYRRRSDLKKIVEKGIREGSLEDYQIGLIIHAFADSYAHTTIEDGRLSAFGYEWGHLFHGHAPDVIVHDPEKYKDYACHLYQALALSNACAPRLNELFEMIDKLASSRDAELPKFEFYAAQLLFDATLYENYGIEWEKSVGKTQVSNTIKEIEEAITD